MRVVGFRRFKGANNSIRGFGWLSDIVKRYVYDSRYNFSRISSFMSRRFIKVVI